jgi:hypothetical protein
MFSCTTEEWKQIRERDDITNIHPGYGANSYDGL